MLQNHAMIYRMKEGKTTGSPSCHVYLLVRNAIEPVRVHSIQHGSQRRLDLSGRTGSDRISPRLRWPRGARSRGLRRLGKAIWMSWDLRDLLFGIFPGLQVLRYNGRLSVCMEAGFGGKQGGKKRVHTFLHQSRWLRAMLSAISRMSATFWRWKRSRSAWIVELEYFRSCADKCSASSSYSIARLKGPSGGDATEHVHTCEIDSRVLLIPFRRAVSGSTSIIPCNV